MQPRPRPASTPRRRAPRPGWCVAALLGLVLLLGPVLPAAGQAPPPNPSPSAPGALVLESIELQGATRTDLATVRRHLPLEPGQPLDQTALVEAVRELRASRLFASVDYYTRPGRARGRLVLVLEVQEHGLDFRLAAGNTDLDGWYLVPAMLAWDNVSGRGDNLDLQWRVGFRHSGLLLNYRQPRSGPAGRDYWGLRLAAITTERPYFSEGVEYRHQVRTAGMAGAYGHRLDDRWLLELGLGLEGVDTADHSVAHSESVDGAVSYDDEIRGADLPAVIRADLGEASRVLVHADLQHDTRARRLRAGSPVAGSWGRLRSQATLQEGRSHLRLQADLRTYREVPGGVLAARLRGAAVGENAAFYDRLYLGGMYTVRGFPTHSLSAPGGDTWLWSGSLEHRSTILADARGGTRLAGVLWLDAGASGTLDDDAYPGVSVGAGYGVRVRVWWLDWLGVDVGFPLTRRPLDQRFQVTASIGWAF